MKDTKIRLTHADYFAGIGGFSLAAEWLGIETVYTSENDDFRHNWLKHRFNNAIHEKDITQTEGYPADIFTGGFPCQDISAANPKGKGVDGGERSGLWHELFRVTAKHRPRYLLLENSPRLIHRGLRNILGQLASIGYDAEWNVFSKRTLGFADIRKRLFLVAYPMQIRLDSAKVFTQVAYYNGRKAIKQKIDFLSTVTGIYSLEIRNTPIPELIQSDAGLSAELVKNEIMAYGDAVCPHVAFVVMHMILQYEVKLKTFNNLKQ